MNSISVIHIKQLVGNWKANPHYVYIGRPNLLGNPFVIGKDGTRDEVIAKYARWLQHVGQKDERIRNALNAILQLLRSDSITLVCYCAPAACHGDIIATWLREHQEDN